MKTLQKSTFYVKVERFNINGYKNNDHVFVKRHCEAVQGWIDQHATQDRTIALKAAPQGKLHSMCLYESEFSVPLPQSIQTGPTQF